MESEITAANFIPARRAAGCPFHPPPDYQRRLESEPISRVTLWNGQEAWFIARYDLARAVLFDSRFSSDASRPGYPHETPALEQHRVHDKMLITLDPPEHTSLRRLLARDFMIKRVEALRPRVEEVIDGLLDEIMAGPPTFDLYRGFALHIPQIVVCELLGLPYDDREYLTGLLENISGVNVTAEAGRAANDAYLEYLDRVVASKEREPGDDVVSRLLEHVQTGELSRRDVIVNLRLLVVAGFESTAKQITVGLLLLMQHPDELEALRADPGLVDGAVEETLRFVTIDHFGRRRVATEDIEVGGQLIRAGEGVVISHSIANRDPEAFSNPTDFDIRRDARHHLAFSFGAHQCLGQPLARLELRVAFTTVLRRMPDLRLAVPFEEIRFMHDSTLYGVEELPVTWHPEPAGVQ
jgi:cytochrome P450